MKWRFVDFVVHGDSLRGVTLYASPNQASVLGARPASGEIKVMHLDPDLVRQWTAVMQQIVDTISAGTQPVIIGPVLTGVEDSSHLAIGIDSGSTDTLHFFLQLDAPSEYKYAHSRPGWRTGAEAPELVQLLLALASEAGRSALRTTQDEDGIASPRELTEPPSRVSGPLPEYPLDELRAGAQGRVWLEFIIDTQGRPEMNSATVVLSDGRGFAEAGLHTLRGTRFRPAQVRGRPVRVRVDIPINFDLRR